MTGSITERIPCSLNASALFCRAASGMVNAAAATLPPGRRPLGWPVRCDMPMIVIGENEMQMKSRKNETHMKERKTRRI